MVNFNVPILSRICGVNQNIDETATTEMLLEELNDVQYEAPLILRDCKQYSQAEPVS